MLQISIAADTLELARTDFKVVGFVQSTGLIDRRVKGSTTLGSGSLDFFVAIPLANFTSDTYTAMNVGYANLTGKNSFLDPYLDAMDDHVDQLTKKFSGRATARLSELQKIANDKIAPQEAELATGQTQLTEGQNQLQTAQATLDEQKATLATQKTQLTAAYGEATATAQLTEATTQLAAAQASLDEQKATLATKQTELDEGKQKIADAKAEVDSLKTPTYYFNLRADNPGYAEYAALTEQINAIANIFPVFFFLIAILITFTTMTRMIEENRREIGTLKALGYHKLEIAQKYLLYAFLATILGVTCGVLIGSNALPYIAYAMFKEHYIFGNLQLNYQWLFIFLATLASLLATIGALAYILTKELREKPADLMLAKAPKGGQRIFLEYFKRLWARLSFNQKVSYRNLFRYKARMVVTVIGIAGCTGLMLAGFGLKESIQAPGTRQLNGITDYQALITLTDDHEDLAKIETFLTDEAQIKSELAVYQQQLTVKKTGVATQPVSLIVPSDTKALAQFIHLKDPATQKVIPLPAKGAVISKKLAQLFSVEVGDTLRLTLADEKVDVKIAAIADYYLGHALWLAPSYYETLTGSTFAANSYLARTENLATAAQDKLAKSLNATGNVINTTFVQTQMKKQLSSTDNLGPIVWIFIILSGTLAFVVLYNLTNINISERVRELATIKVLGFYDGEVTMYILRENLIFTLLGVLVGFGIGNVLTYAIIKMAETAEFIFPLVIPAYGYVVSGVLTFVFSAIVLFVTHFKLKHINMIEALKSNE